MFVTHQTAFVKKKKKVMWISDGTPLHIYLCLF